MRKAVTYIVSLDLLFVAILAASGFFDSIVGEIVYYLAFILPLVFAFLFAKGEGFETKPLNLGIKKEGGVLTLPLIFPTLLLIFFVSYLTSLLLSLTGSQNEVDLSGNIFRVIFFNALLPSVFEELLFRYMPLMLLVPHSKRSAVLLSSLFFALIHCNLYQIPYAFVAGIIFATLDVMFESILPSVALHFLNNVFSIVWIRGADNQVFTLVYVIVLVALALASMIPVLILKPKYVKRLSPIFADKSKEKLSFEPIILAVVTLSVALLSL